MNLGTLRAKALRRTGLPSDDPMLDADVVNDAVMTALRHIETLDDWWWLIARETLTTTASNEVLTPNVRTQRTKSLTYVETGFGALQQVALEELLSERSASTGRPQRWAEQGASIILDPIPSDAFELYHVYVTTEAELVDDAGTPLLPDRYSDAVIEYAAHLLLRRVRDQERAGEAFAAYQVWEARMRDNARRSSKPKVVQVRDW